MIEKLKPNGNWWIDPKGVTHPDRAAYIQDYLGICGCGDSRAVLGYVKHILERCNADGWDSFNYEDLPLMFTLNMLDKLKLIEHGSTIRCSWLTELGEEILTDIGTALSEPEVNFND